ncbi:MAG: right-handed parallel beta-helix repeat-containing protein [Planctomycetota bacterium]
MKTTKMLSILVLALGGFAQARTITVGPGASHDFDTIQVGIDAANDADTVLVAPGEYVITVPVTFRGKAITVISETGPDETTIRMGTSADPNRGSVVIFDNNETAESVLDGFTVTGGRGSWVSSENKWLGGSILFDASSATVSNCAIVQNRVENRGGGVLCLHSCSPRLIDCIISENSSATSSGGGVFALSGASLTLSNCIVKGNSAGTAGGGVACAYSSSVTLTNCTIAENSTRDGGGVYCGINSSMTITDCIIRGNSAGNAGGGVICDQNSSMIMTGCTISENFADHGAGVMCWDSSSLTLSNCTIAKNSAERLGVGLFSGRQDSVTVTNSIIWGNTAPQGHELSVRNAATFSINYSNVTGGQNAVSGITINLGAGNICADPYFAKPGYWADINDPNVVVEPDDPNAVWIDGDYHLKSQAGRWDPYSDSWVIDDVTSPCIDRGDPNCPIGDEPMPNGGIINMGAYGGTREASMSIGQLPPLPPLAHWKLDETEGNIAHDSAGNKDGILNCEPLWQPSGGMIDGALEFDGVDDHVSTEFILNPADGEFGIFAWIRGGAPGQVIISQTGGANWLLADLSEGKLRTSLLRPGGGRTVPQPLISEFIITDGNWHRVGLTWDGSNKILYADDLEVARDTQTSLGSSEGGLYIGAGSTLDVANFFSGLIDDVRIYNRAITP